MVRLFRDWYADKDTRHLYYAFTTTYDGPIAHQADEIAWGAWLTLDELVARLADPAWPFVPDGRDVIERWLADPRRKSRNNGPRT